MRRALLSLLIGSALCLGVAGPPVAAAGPARPASELSSSVWLPYWSMDTAYRRVLAHRDLFATASPFWYDARSCSRIVGHAGAGDRGVVRGLRRQGLAVVPSVTATALTPRAAIRCLGDRTRRSAHVDRLMELVGSRAYDGLDFDYEHLALTTDAAQAARVRRAFTRFVREACGRLRAAGKRCEVTVMPRTGDEPTVWRGKLIPAVYDYAAIGAVADRVRVMAYDQHASTTGPGPMAGFPWVRSVVGYATSVVPRSKLELGVPMYGRVWADGTATALTGDQARDLARRHGVTPRWDRVQREATFRFRAGGTRHTVWFSSPRAVAARTSLAAGSGLAGAAYWAASLEQTGTWRAVRARRTR